MYIAYKNWTGHIWVRLPDSWTTKYPNHLIIVCGVLFIINILQSCAFPMDKISLLEGYILLLFCSNSTNFVNSRLAIFWSLFSYQKFCLLTLSLLQTLGLNSTLDSYSPDWDLPTMIFPEYDALVCSPYLVFVLLLISHCNYLE